MTDTGFSDTTAGYGYATIWRRSVHRRYGHCASCGAGTPALEACWPFSWVEGICLACNVMLQNARVRAGIEPWHNGIAPLPFAGRSPE